MQRWKRHAANEGDPVSSSRARFGVTSARILEDCFGVLDIDSEAFLSGAGGGPGGVFVVDMLGQGSFLRQCLGAGRTLCGVSEQTNGKEWLTRNNCNHTSQNMNPRKHVTISMVCLLPTNIDLHLHLHQRESLCLHTHTHARTHAHTHTHTHTHTHYVYKI